MTAAFEEIRQQYQPKTIKLIFIAEAVQPGKVFFYRKNSNVFRAVKEAFTLVFGAFKSDDEFLNFFKETGCYVDYLCPDLINGLLPEIRQQVRRDGIKPLSERLAIFRPKAVITVMKALEKEVMEAVELCGITAVPYRKAVTFPAHSKTNADKCVKEVVEVLNELLEIGVLGD